MDPNVVAKLMKDDFDTPDPDEDFDDADLESELAGIVGGKSLSKIDKPQAKKSVATKGKPGKRQPPKNPGEEEDGN